MPKKVYIGIGHGGSDPGAVGNGLRESDLNLSVGKHCGDYLKSRGVSVKISRTTDSDVWLETRIKQANEFKADLAIDIHHNAGGGDGAEVYHSVVGGTSKTLATNIIAEVGKIGQNSRGIKTKTNGSGKDYFGFIRQTNMPAVLVECAFVDSKDVQIVDTEAERKKMGEAIAKAVIKTLGIKDVVISAKKGYAGTFPTLPNRGYLKRGDKGQNVRYLQSFLVWYGFKITVDGDFGPKTDNAVRDFQDDYSLTVDGLFGKKSLEKAKTIKK